MGMMDLLRGGRSEDPETSTLWTTPWMWRDDEGLYVGSKGQVWLYRCMPIDPIDPHWEDAPARLGLGRRLERMLVDLGATSKESPMGLRQFGTNREIHLLSITWRTEARAPSGVTPRHREYLDETLGFLVPTKALFIGVRLWATGESDEKPSLLKQLKDAATSALGEEVPDVDRYEQDRSAVETILSRWDARVPRVEELRQLESWYNLGRGPDAVIAEERTHVRIDDVDRIEMAAVYRFNQRINIAPHFQWIADAESHENGAHVISVRAELEPATAARSRARQSQRRIRAMIDEEMETSDVERPEYTDTFAAAQAVEDHFLGSDQPLMTKCSILLARRAVAADDTYIDMLRNNHQIEVRPLDYRQLPALDETLPCSVKRANPFLQDVSVAMLAYAGMHGFSALGDGKGAYLGLTHPNLTPCYMDWLRSGGENKPPITAIFGSPGSGKTFLSSSIATQAAFAGLPVIFINPKSGGIGSSISGVVEYAGGRRISLSEMATSKGSFDPFRYADPERAAELLSGHITSSLRELSEADQLDVAHGIRTAVTRGARCAKDALRGIDNPRVVKLIAKLVNSDPMFALAFGMKPASEMGVGDGITLIEFDRPLPLPDPNQPAEMHSTAERVALSTITLVTRASIQMLANAGGGVLIVDEAWTFLNHPAGRAELERLGREGRSLNVQAIFATQRVADLLRHDMAAYMSRVFVMRLDDEKEADAAFEIVGLEPTPARRSWLSDAGPRPADPETGRPARWAMALHRDLWGRHSAILVGPTPAAAMEAWTTNPEDRKRKAAEAAARGGRHDGSEPGGDDTAPNPQPPRG